jgi:hypothetical protein
MHCIACTHATIYAVEAQGPHSSGHCATGQGDCRVHIQGRSQTERLQENRFLAGSKKHALKHLTASAGQVGKDKDAAADDATTAHRAPPRVLSVG